ncbi:MAG: outer membrane protein assembly factor BamE [Halieaceae bacterium]|jgi:outer membrane protein assembly factor BamE
MRLLISALLVTVLSACGFVGFPGAYKIDIEQGNIVTSDMVDQLKEGMSRRQVRFILGTPLVEDSFNQNRWDYPYTVRNGSDLLDSTELAVHFEGDKLVRVTGDYLPEWADTGLAPEQSVEVEAEVEPEAAADSEES